MNLSSALLVAATCALTACAVPSAKYTDAPLGACTQRRFCWDTTETLRDLWQVFKTNNSMHSCYGTGAAGCMQVEIPTPGGHQGTPEGNAKLIRYEGGVRVDKENLQNKQRNVP